MRLPWNWQRRRAPRRFSLPAEFVTPRAFYSAAQATAEQNSPAEEQGSELLVLSRVPLSRRAERRSGRSQNSWGDRRFESFFLQRRVSSEVGSEPASVRRSGRGN